MKKKEFSLRIFIQNWMDNLFILSNIHFPPENINVIILYYD